VNAPQPSPYGDLWLGRPRLGLAGDRVACWATTTPCRGRLARSFENTLDSASGWLQVACLAAVLDALVTPPHKVAAANELRAAKLLGYRATSSAGAHF
jgi:hypothetical protein